MTDLPPYFELNDDIIALDSLLGRPGLAAYYLVRQGDALALVDTGTAHSVQGLLSLLAYLGLVPQQVRYIIPTHVHLDHAGGAGALMAACPEATLVCHPKGAPHMIDPARLEAGSKAVYGEAAFVRDYDHLQPIPADRVRAAEDGLTLDLNSRALQIIHSPGHANHHACIWDPQSQGLFTGDSYGIAYEAFVDDDKTWIFAPTTPVAFDPAAWHQSLDKLAALKPKWAYRTHFGRGPFTSKETAQLRASVDAMRQLALNLEAADPAKRPDLLRHQVRELLRTEIKDAGFELSPEQFATVMAFDIELNAQGLEVWLQRRAKRREGHVSI